MKARLGPYEGKAIRLRLLSEEDLPLTMAWRNKERSRGMFRKREVISKEGHGLWFQSYLAREDDFVFVIETRDGLPIGQISLYQVNPPTGDAELGRMMIGEDAFLRKGHALEAIELLVGTTAPALGLEEVYLEVRLENLPAIGLYKKAGFMEDGHAIDPDGTFLRMSIDVPTPP